MARQLEARSSLRLIGTAGLTLLVVLAMIVAWFYLVDLSYNNPDARTRFLSYAGSLEGIFSGLALVAVVVSLQLQRHEAQQGAKATQGLHRLHLATARTLAISAELTTIRELMHLGVITPTDPATHKVLQDRLAELRTSREELRQFEK